MGQSSFLSPLYGSLGSLAFTVVKATHRKFCLPAQKMVKMQDILAEVGPKRHHHRKGHRNPLTGQIMPNHPAYSYEGDGSDLTGAPTGPLFEMNKPKYDKRTVEKYLRTNMLSVLTPSTSDKSSDGLRSQQGEIQTTTAVKLVMKGARHAQAELDKAQREREKARQEEESKASAMKKLLATVAKHKLDTRMDKRVKDIISPEATQAQLPEEVEGESGDEWVATGEDEMGAFHSYWDTEVNEDEDEGDGYGPREEHYDNVYADAAPPRIKDPRDPDKPPARMYNVQLQVRPKDLAQIYATAPWRPRKPKMYDVALQVGPHDWDKIRPKSCWDRAPGYDDDHVQDEYLGEEEEGEEPPLERKPSKRADAGVLARPLGYKELRLSISMDAITMEAEVQVNEIDIEKALAAQRGIILTDDNILWPTVREFTTNSFELKIERYVDQCWKIEPGWMYTVQYLQHHTSNYRNKYIFQVLFSMPTATNPIPAATASVYFVAEMPHYGHLDDQVKVHYCVEGMRFAHSPGHLPFQSKWLASTIHDKIRVQKAWAAELESVCGEH